MDISQLVRFARCCTSIVDFHSKNLQITSNFTIDTGLQMSQASKTFGKYFRSHYYLLSKFGDISFQEYVCKGISHPVFYGYLVYKLRGVKGAKSRPILDGAGSRPAFTTNYFSTPEQKPRVSYCHSTSSIVHPLSGVIFSHFRLLLQNRWTLYFFVYILYAWIHNCTTCSSLHASVNCVYNMHVYWPL